jgi:hypothetical protein
MQYKIIIKVDGLAGFKPFVNERYGDFTGLVRLEEFGRTCLLFI